MFSVLSVDVFALAKEIQINGSGNQTAEKFELTNMFPGDVEEKEYIVKIGYKGDATLHFDVEITKDSKLSEVMQMKVEVDGSQIYDGLMADVNDLQTVLPTGGENASKEISYKITVSLDTSVGNEYQNKELKGNFIWWAEGEDIDGAQTGDMSPVWIIVCVVACAALAVVFVILSRRKKDDREKSKT